MKETKRQQKRGPPLDLSSAPSQVWSVGVETSPIVTNMDGKLGSSSSDSSAVRRWCADSPAEGLLCVKAQPSPARPKKKVAHLRVLELGMGRLRPPRRPRKGPGAAVVIHHRVPSVRTLVDSTPAVRVPAVVRYRALGSRWFGPEFRD
ncbi:hypothetical protein SMAC4_14012 [Sordaria macrospora]|uniref:uncharacterized protein n=1 Tax=Sordaria macrospora TaxID=5147 RepID=UPI002B2DB867|nr:hypothetical protein SMAC4_14012 [Sordaria macrospora]